MIENIRAMLVEIAKMKIWCNEHYEQGADVMIECWNDEDYEDLFYTDNLDETTHNIVPRVRVPFAKAWETLKQLTSIYEDQEADAKNSAF